MTTGTFHRQLLEYGSFVRALLHDFQPWRKTMLLAGFGMLMGTVGQLAGFAIVYKYLAVLRADAEILLPGLGMVRASDLPAFLLVAVCGTAAMIGAAIADYRGRIAGFDLGEAYSLFGEERLLAIRLALGSGRGKLLEGAIGEALIQQNRLAGTACRQLTASFSHFVAFPLGLGLMLHLDVGLTFAVCTVLLPGSFLLYRASLAVAASRRSELIHSVAARAELDSSRKARGGSLPPHSGEADGADSDALLGAASGDLREAQRRQHLIVQRGTLIGQLVTAVCVFVVFVIGGERAISNGHGWGELVVFLLVLRLVGSRLTAMVRTLIALNRLYPGLRRYFAVLEALEEESSRARDGSRAACAGSRPLAPDPRASCQLRLDGGRLTRLEGGELIGLWCATPGIRAIGEQLRRSMHAPGTIADNWPSVVSVPAELPADDLRQVLGLADASEVAAFQKRLTDSGFPPKLAAVLGSCDAAGQTPATPARATILCMAAETFRLLDAGAGTLLYRAQDLNVFSRRLRLLLLDLCLHAGRLVLLQFERASTVEAFPLERVLVSDGNALVAENSLSACRQMPAPSWSRRPASQLDALDRLLQLLR